MRRLGVTQWKDIVLGPAPDEGVPAIQSPQPERQEQPTRVQRRPTGGIVPASPLRSDD